MKLYRALPMRGDAQVVGRQLLRSATSVAANYRSALRARSRAEFTSKLGIVVEEADEALFWLELLRDGEVLPAPQLKEIIEEAEAIVAIFASGRSRAKTAR